MAVFLKSIGSEIRNVDAVSGFHPSALIDGNGKALFMRLAGRALKNGLDLILNTV